MVLIEPHGKEETPPRGMVPTNISRSESKGAPYRASIRPVQKPPGGNRIEDGPQRGAAKDDAPGGTSKNKQRVIQTQNPSESPPPKALQKGESRPRGRRTNIKTPSEARKRRTQHSSERTTGRTHRRDGRHRQPSRGSGNTDIR